MIWFLAGICFCVAVESAAYFGWREHARRSALRALHEKQLRSAARQDKYDADPQLKLRDNARSWVRSAYKQQIQNSQKLGYSPQELEKRFAASFQDGMTHENYGKVWEIDHVRALKHYDLTDPGKFHAAIHPSNLQPLFRGENHVKGSS